MATLLGCLAAALGACSSEPSERPMAEACGAPPYFTVLPVPEADLTSVPVFGGLDAPGHVLPTPHGGLFLAREHVPLRAPADMTITGLRRVRYSGPDVPPDKEDYAISFRVCRELTGWFGHVTSLAPRFSPETVDFRDCRSYSVPWAKIETCEAHDLDIKVLAGDDLGTGGPVIDMGVEDERVTNFYVAPHRFGGASHAVCMWEQFDTENQAILFSKLRDIQRPELDPVGEPRCGTMEIDVVGTAKGVWAEIGAGPTGGDERQYIALANYPYRPGMELALSLGPQSLGERLAVVERATSGRVNRAFEDVTPDGLIYCYGPQVNSPSPSSWFVQVTSETTLRIQLVEHEIGSSPCDADPATWSFGPTAVEMIR